MAGSEGGVRHCCVADLTQEMRKQDLGGKMHKETDWERWKCLQRNTDQHKITAKENM